MRDSERTTTTVAVKGKFFVLEVDGTPHVGELLGGVIRFGDDNNRDIHQRLLSVIHLPKSPDSLVLGDKMLQMTAPSVFAPLLTLFSHLAG